jgi:hypothetical protein
MTVTARHPGIIGAGHRAGRAGSVKVRRSSQKKSAPAERWGGDHHLEERSGSDRLWRNPFPPRAVPYRIVRLAPRRPPFCEPPRSLSRTRSRATCPVNRLGFTGETCRRELQRSTRHPRSIGGGSIKGSVGRAVARQNGSCEDLSGGAPDRRSAGLLRSRPLGRLRPADLGRPAPVLALPGLGFHAPDGIGPVSC